MKELKDVRYILPPLQGTVPTEMILMVFSRTEKDYLSRTEVGDMLMRIFRYIYEREDDDEILNLILEELPDTISLA